MTGNPERILLKPPLWLWRALSGFLLVLMCLVTLASFAYFVLGSYYVVWLSWGYFHTSDFPDKPTLAAIWSNFGKTTVNFAATLATSWIAVPMLATQARGQAVELDVSNRNLTIRFAHYEVVLDWTNVATLETATVRGRELIGFKLKDRSKFIAEAEALNPAKPWMRWLAGMIAPPRFVVVVLERLGILLPPPFGDIDATVAWIGKRTGYDIVVFKSSCTDFPAVVAALNSRFDASLFVRETRVDLDASSQTRERPQA